MINQQSRHDPLKCDICGDYYSVDRICSHKSLHTRPSQHIGKTKTFPNNIKKSDIFKPLNIEELYSSKNSGGIDIESIQFDDFPQPQYERKSMTIPTSFKETNRTELKTTKRSYAKDQLQLNSNLIYTDLTKEDLAILNIENIIGLKQIKSRIPNRQIRTYTHSKQAIKVTGNGGRQDRKINLSRSSSLNTSAQQTCPQNIYLANKDSNKVASSLHKNKISTVTVSLNIRKPQFDTFTPVNTKSSDVKIRTSQQSGQIRLPRAKQIPIHQHQCPDCHGFYCKTCKSTIPPKFRPFWDDNQSPQLVEYYKMRLEEGNKKISKDCSQKGKC